jgi:hypothetical protein
MKMIVPAVATMRLDLSGPLSESLTGKCQSSFERAAAISPNAWPGALQRSAYGLLIPMKFSNPDGIPGHGVGPAAGGSAIKCPSSCASSTRPTGSRARVRT